VSSPKYTRLGELVCASCEKVIEQALTQRGDAMARCENPECKDPGTYEIGSFRHTPAPDLRPPQIGTLPAYRYIWGQPNWQVKDGHKTQENT
jgi:hypothetical protein